MNGGYITNLNTTGLSICVEPHRKEGKAYGWVQCAPIHTGRERALGPMNAFFEGFYVNTEMKLCCKAGSACTQWTGNMNATKDICKFPSDWDGKHLTIMQQQKPFEILNEPHGKTVMPSEDQLQGTAVGPLDNGKHGSFWGDAPANDKSKVRPY